MRLTVDRTIILASAIWFVTSCSDSEAGDGGPSACVNGQFCVGNLVCVAGLCIEPSGTDSFGDGDGDSGDGDDGDGDGDSGDGDGDSGDGDGDSGDGDGDSGDGDGDEPAECGNGVVEGDEACDDGNAVNADVCTNGCAWGPLTKIVFARPARRTPPISAGSWAPTWRVSRLRMQPACPATTWCGSRPR
jgi:cysteine-rich repeat protein